MSEVDKMLDAEKARRAAEKFILDRYPYSNVAFQREELKTCGTRQVYEFAGYSVLAKWPKATAIKRLCQIQVDAYSADIVEYHGI